MGTEMKLSSVGLAAILFLPLLTAEPASAGGITIVRPGGWAHADHPRFAAQDRRFTHEADARFDNGRRFRHNRSDSSGDWGGGYGYNYDPGDEGPVVDAPSRDVFMPGGIDITINVAPPASAGHAIAPAQAPTGGPRIITIGADAAPGRLTNMPIVIYGRPPLGQAD